MDEVGEVDNAAVVASSEASEMFEATEASLDLVAQADMLEWPEWISTALTIEAARGACR